MVGTIANRGVLSLHKFGTPAWGKGLIEGGPGEQQGGWDGQEPKENKKGRIKTCLA